MRPTRASMLRTGLTVLCVAVLVVPVLAWCGEDAAVDVVIGPDATPLVPNSSHVLQGWVHALDDVGTMHLDLSSTGAITLTGPVGLDLGSLAQGDSIAFSIPVTYGAEGLSQVHVTVTVSLDTGSSSAGSESFDFYTLVRTPPFNSETSMDGSEIAQFDGVEADSAAGLITPQQADSLEEAYLDAPEDAAIDSTGPVPGSIGARSGRPNAVQVANVTVVGKLVWTDKNGATHPAILTRVELWDHETIGADRLLASDLTDETGTVSFTVPNDDGFLGGGIDAYLKLYTSNPYVYLHAPGQNSYRAATIRRDNLSDNATYTYRVTIKNLVDTGCSWSVFQALTQAARYAETRNGAAFPQVDATWPTARGCAYSTVDGILIRPSARWEWDPIMHEYGHYVQSQLGTTANPGGPHTKACLSVEQGSKDRGVRMAWAEGWATYFGIVAQAVRNLGALGIPEVGDVFYDSFNGTIHLSLEAQDNTRIGEDCEWAVARSLWDLYDTVNDGYESVTLGDQVLWDAVKGAKSKTLSQAWGTLRAATADAGQDLAIAGVASNHQTAAVATAPADGAAVVAGTTFNWPRAVGCSNPNLGDSFDMVFFKPGTPPTRLAAIASMSNLANPTHDLTAAEFTALLPQAANDGTLLWAVEARNTGAPATGPYLGVARRVQLTAPVATLLSPESARVAPDAVTMYWQGPGASTLDATVYRRDDSGAWQALGKPAVVASDRLSYEDRTVVPGAHYTFRLGYVVGASTQYTEGTSVDVPMRPVLAFEGFRPNPAGARPSIVFSTPDARALSIDVLDVAGRRVWTRDLGTMSPGQHVVDVGGGLAPGVYLMKLRSGARTISARGVVMP